MLRLELLALLFVGICALPAQSQEKLAVAYPGPWNVPFLPLDLAPRIGADKAYGIELVPHHASGALSLQHLQNRNVDFAAPGTPAAMLAKATGNNIVAVAPIGDRSVYKLLVRNELKGKIKRPRDLAGRVVGVTTSSMTIKTTSHQVAELILKTDGVPAAQIRLAPAGMSWPEMLAMLDTGAIDALLSFEPHASRMSEEGRMYVLFDLTDPPSAMKVPGAEFIPAALVTRGDVIANTPARVERLVATLQHTFNWMSAHSPEQIVEALKIDDGETRRALLRALRQHTRLYSPDGKFSTRQIRETDRFYAATEGSKYPLKFEAMLDDRWAGRKP